MALLSVFTSLLQNLAAERTYGNLDVTLSKALHHRAQVLTCCSSFPPSLPPSPYLLPSLPPSLPPSISYTSLPPLTQGFEGVHTCKQTDSLHTIVCGIINAKVISKRSMCAFFYCVCVCVFLSSRSIDLWLWTRIVVWLESFLSQISSSF